MREVCAACEERAVFLVWCTRVWADDVWDDEGIMADAGVQATQVGRRTYGCGFPAR